MEEKHITNEKSESEIIEEQNEKIKNLENKINELLQALVSNKDVDKNEESQDVTIVSLCNGILVLSTEGYGRGDVYVFRKFGEEKVVDRADAKRIIRNNLSFFQKGKAYITDQKLIESERLTSAYKTMLSKDDFLKLLSSKAETFELIFDTIPKGQQDSIIEMLTQKLLDGEKVDRNIIYYIKETRGIDISENTDYLEKIKE